MTSHSELIDSELRKGPALARRVTPPAEFGPLVEHFKSGLPTVGPLAVRTDLKRDELLMHYRIRFTAQVRHDVDYTLQRLWHWAENPVPQSAISRTVHSDAQIMAGFRDLSDLRRFLMQHDAWANTRVELACWRATQQFYCDALALADRLRRFEQDNRVRRRRRAGLRRRSLGESAASYSSLQAIMNALEQALPNFLNLHPWHVVLPIISYLAARSLVPWPAYRWATAADKLRRLVSSGALGRLADAPGPSLMIRGLDRLLAHDSLFDPLTRKTRRNVILAGSHRHSVLDLPIFVQALHGIDHGLWGNELYFPKSAARDRRMALVRPGQKRDLGAALEKSAEILTVERVPLFLMVDGSGPYFLYGQQMRVKRGIRLLLEYLRERCHSTTRGTSIVPISFDDTASYLRGLDQVVIVTFHPPIHVEDIEAPPRTPDRGRTNFGDPLLNFLELLFLVNSGQVRHGWQTPEVIDTVRRVSLEVATEPSLGGWLRRRYHASIFDLARMKPTGVYSIPPSVA